MARIKELGNGNYSFKCPGCRSHHLINRRPQVPGGVCWTFVNLDLDRPTFKPSIKCTWGKYLDEKSRKQLNVKQEDYDYWVKEDLGTKCHFFLRNGIVEFGDDCSHDLKGKHVELPNIY